MQPYPGLRPFEPDEALKFHGRETHTAELLHRLSANRFIAVTGNSGSGKSSLVRAGLLPALHRGRLIGATSQWRICILRPGDRPMQSLAASLAAQQVSSADEKAVFQEVTRSSLGLVRTVRASQFTPGESLLLVVDQFEELFRFVRERKEHDGGAESRLFVSSLLEAADLSSAPVYVVLTMRSDFLGDCSQFPGLPEALNRSQYLIPRMTREQVRDAIKKPLRLVNARMSPRLVERLLNELGDDTGQLPVLQHALNRTFHEFAKKGAQGEISIEDYAAAGELKGALNAHAESLFSLQFQYWTECVFRCLTTVEGGRKIRRPTRLGRLFEITGARDEASRKRVREVVRAYAHRDHAMLIWSGKELNEDSVVDISHESLIELWTRLRGWVSAEDEAANLYLSAVEDAVRNRRGSAAKWRHLKLAEALVYLEKGPWNTAWAERVGSQGARFEEVKGFLEREAAAEHTEEREREAIHARELVAEQRAKKDAEARAKAEGQKKSWVMMAAMLGVAVLLLGLTAAISIAKRADTERTMLESRKSVADSLQQIQASDDIVKQNVSQQQELRGKIDDVTNPDDKTRLQSKLKELTDQEVQVRAQRDAAQARLNSESKTRTRVNPVDGLTYTFIPAGNFIMGCSTGDTECDDDEKPPRAVQMASGFWLGQTEVTQAAWKKVNGGANPSYFKSNQLPVENVDWIQASGYCIAIGGRLPTEKEWEYAARGGTTGARYEQLDLIAWYGKNSGGTTHPIALQKPNAYGLHDILGNVWEWTSDDYASGGKVVRGGSWVNRAGVVRASDRFGDLTKYRSYDIGFRCVGE